jgi:hypothetical protein
MYPSASSFPAFSAISISKLFPVQSWTIKFLNGEDSNKLTMHIGSATDPTSLAGIFPIPRCMTVWSLHWTFDDLDLCHDLMAFGDGRYFCYTTCMGWCLGPKHLEGYGGVSLINGIDYSTTRQNYFPSQFIGKRKRGEAPSFEDLFVTIDLKRLIDLWQWFWVFSFSMIRMIQSVLCADEVLCWGPPNHCLNQSAFGMLKERYHTHLIVVWRCRAKKSPSTYWLARPWSKGVSLGSTVLSPDDMPD